LVAGDPRQLVEAMVDAVAVRATPERDAHHREGSVRYTVAGIIAEEQRIFEMVGQSDTRALLDLRREDAADLSVDQQRAIANIADSPFLIQPLPAPAGAGKTHSLKALRAAAHRGGKQVLVLAPTGKAVDEAMRDGAGDRGLTVAKALKLIADNEIDVDPKTVVVVDEASMVGTGDLKNLLSCAAVGRAKMVLVGDPYQLAPVRARGGMFEMLCDELPWAQRLSEVWRMRNPAERDASLALRSGRGNRLRRAIGWYRTQGRLHTGDPIAMAHDAEQAYRTAREQGKDVAIICDQWEIADAINRRLHTAYTDTDAPHVTAAREQQVCAGDLIMTRNNDASIAVAAADGSYGPTDQVRNGNRWTVVAVNADHGRIAAERVGDGARAIFENDYVREHITLGYAGTVHSAQGITVGSAQRYGVCWSIMSENAGRALAYVAATRAKDENHLAIYQPNRGEADHEHRDLVDGTTVHHLRRGNKYASAYYLSRILQNADRPRCLHAEAERSPAGLLPDPVADAVDTLAAQRSEWAGAYRKFQTFDRTVTDRYVAWARRTAERERSQRRGGAGLEW
jgi:ATP-dependent exoDNAse (exonuclease V) alpha subunit